MANMYVTKSNIVMFTLTSRFTVVIVLYWGIYIYTGLVLLAKVLIAVYTTVVSQLITVQYIRILNPAICTS